MDDFKPVFIVSAPSGTGKTTLNRMLCKKHPAVEICVSLTTRPKRAGEKEGRDYEYVSAEEFLKHVNRGEMLEWANVHGNLYGTSKQKIGEIEARGHKAILEIDVQGWETVRKKLRNPVSVFILPPSIKTLWERMEGRGADSEQTRWNRLLNAKKEIQHAQTYDYFIINEDVESALTELESIIVENQKGRLESSDGARLCAILLEEFQTSSFLRELSEKYARPAKA